MPEHAPGLATLSLPLIGARVVGAVAPPGHAHHPSATGRAVRGSLVVAETGGRDAGVGGAGVGVVAGLRRPATDAGRALVAESAGVAVVAVRNVGDGCVRAAGRRDAGVDRAGVGVRAVGADPRHADAADAGVAVGAGVAVVARQRVVGVGALARRRVARVGGAGVVVVAVGGRLARQTLRPGGV